MLAFASTATAATNDTPVWHKTFGPTQNGNGFGYAFTPDGSRVIATGVVDNDLALVSYDPHTGTKQWKAAAYDGPGHGQDVASSAAFTPDGATVVVAGLSVGADDEN